MELDFTRVTPELVAAAIVADRLKTRNDELEAVFAAGAALAEWWHHSLPDAEEWQIVCDRREEALERALAAAGATIATPWQPPASPAPPLAGE